MRNVILISVGINLILVTYIMVSQFVITLSDGMVWGKWTESQYCINNQSNTLSKAEFLELNSLNMAMFNELILRKLIVCVSCVGLNDEDKVWYRKAIMTINCIRGGNSNNGGQWPIDVNFIPKESICIFPERFITNSNFLYDSMKIAQQGDAPEPASPAR